MKAKQQVIALGILLILGCVGLAVVNGLRHRQSFVLGHTRNVGLDLVAHTNSTHLARINPLLHQQLAHLLRAPTHIEKTLAGDEPPPLGNGKACSRLILSNENGERMGIRLMQADKPERFLILGFWMPTDEGKDRPGAKH